METSEVEKVKKETENMKYRPEFPKNMKNYSFMNTTYGESKRVEIMLINELRAEFIDKEILDAIKRG